MIQLNDPALKRALIEKHHFQEHFSLDLEKCSVLLRCEAGETLCHSGEIYPDPAVGGWGTHSLQRF